MDQLIGFLLLLIALPYVADGPEAPRRFMDWAYWVWMILGSILGALMLLGPAR